MSSTPVIVTYCVEFQYPVVKVKLAGATEDSVASFAVRSTTTFPTGCTPSTTVKVAVFPPPEASVTVAVVPLNVTAAVSLSVVVAT